MLQNSVHTIMMFCLAALLAPALNAQARPTCNGLPATIVATAPGQIVGTPGDDVIVGTNGADQIFGMAGNDTICGLAGNDQITGGFGKDAVFGQAGNDTFFWNPGDSDDLIEGSSENDTLQINGSGASEIFDLSANGNRLRLTRNIANIVLDVAGVETVSLRASGSPDRIAVNRLTGTGVQQVTLDLSGFQINTPDGQADAVQVFGGPAADQITVASFANKVNIRGVGPAIDILNSEAALDSLSIDGMAGNDRIGAVSLTANFLKLTLNGGPGDDILTGSPGADVLDGGDDNDTLLWTLGQPADVMSGQAGVDKLEVAGAAGPDNVVVSAIPAAIHVLNVSDGVQFEAAVEEIIVQAGRGADQITIVPVAGATAQKVIVDLRPPSTPAGGDTASDSVIVQGTPAADNIAIAGSAGNITISGLSAAIQVQGSEGVRDTLTINSSHEADVINAQALAAGVTRLVVRGGFGVDTITGSAGEDVFIWSPGDSNDIIDAGPGNDTLQFSGSNIGERISMTANESRLRFTRDIANIVLDVNAVERVTFAAIGGADTIEISDLSATSVRQIALELAAFNGGGDGQSDTVRIIGQIGRAINTVLASSMMTVYMSPVTITITNLEPANDSLVLLPVAAPPVIMSSNPESEIAGVTGKQVKTSTEVTDSATAP